MKLNGSLWETICIAGVVFSHVQAQIIISSNDTDYPDYLDRDYPSMDYYTDYPNREGRSFEKDDVNSTNHNNVDSNHHAYSDAIMKQLMSTIPGIPGVDYALHQSVPETSFDCAKQGSPGFYGDVEAQCQVFHVCQESQRHDSFLCPIGTVFNQISFVCDWWFNFRCQDTPSHYGLNRQFHSLSSSMEDSMRRMGAMKPKRMDSGRRRVGRGFVQAKKKPRSGTSEAPKVMNLFMRRVRKKKLRGTNAAVKVDGVAELDPSVIWSPLETTSTGTNAALFTESHDSITLKPANGALSDLTDFTTKANSGVLSSTHIMNISGDEEASGAAPMQLESISNSSDDVDENRLNKQDPFERVDLHGELSNPSEGQGNNTVKEFDKRNAAVNSSELVSGEATRNSSLEGYKDQTNSNETYRTSFAGISIPHREAKPSIAPTASPSLLNSTETAHLTSKETANASKPFSHHNNFVIGNDTHITVSVTIQSNQGRSRLHWKRHPGAKRVRKVRLRANQDHFSPQTNSINETLYRRRSFSEKPRSRVMWIPARRNFTDRTDGLEKLMIPMSFDATAEIKLEPVSHSLMASPLKAEELVQANDTESTKEAEPGRQGILDAEEALRRVFHNATMKGETPLTKTEIPTNIGVTRETAGTMLMIRPMFSPDFLRSQGRRERTDSDCKTACIRLLRILGRGRTVDGQTSTTFFDAPASSTLFNDEASGSSVSPRFERKGVLGTSSSEHSVKYDHPGPKCKGSNQSKMPVNGWSVIIDSGLITKEKTVKRRGCVGGQGKKTVNSSRRHLKGSSVRFDSRDPRSNRGSKTKGGSMDQRYWLNLVKNWLESSSASEETGHRRRRQRDHDGGETRHQGSRLQRDNGSDETGHGGRGRDHDKDETGHGSRGRDDDRYETGHGHGSRGQRDNGSDWADSFHIPKWDDSRNSYRRANLGSDSQQRLNSDHGWSSDLQTERSDWSEAMQRASESPESKRFIAYTFRDGDLPFNEAGGRQRNQETSRSSPYQSPDKTVRQTSEDFLTRYFSPNGGDSEFQEEASLEKISTLAARPQEWSGNIREDRSEGLPQEGSNKGFNQRPSNNKGSGGNRAPRGKPPQGSNNKGMAYGPPMNNRPKRPDSPGLDKGSRRNGNDRNADRRPWNGGWDQSGLNQDQRNKKNRDSGSPREKGWNLMKTPLDSGAFPGRKDDWDSMKPAVSNPSKGGSSGEWSSDPGWSDDPDPEWGMLSGDWSDEETVGDWSDEQDSPEPWNDDWPNSNSNNRGVWPSKGSSQKPVSNKGYPVKPDLGDSEHRKDQKKGWPRSKGDRMLPEDSSSNRRNSKGDSNVGSSDGRSKGFSGKGEWSDGDNKRSNSKGKAGRRQEGSPRGSRPSNRNDSWSSGGQKPPPRPNTGSKGSKLPPRDARKRNDGSDDDAWRSGKGSRTDASSSGSKGSSRNGRRTSSKTPASWSSGKKQKGSRGQKGQPSRMEGSSKGWSKGGNSNKTKTDPTEGGKTDRSGGGQGGEGKNTSSKGDSEATTIVWSARISDDGKLGNGWVPITIRPDLKKNDSNSNDWSTTKDKNDDQNWPSSKSDENDENWPRSDSAEDDEDWSNTDADSRIGVVNRDEDDENWPSSNVDSADEDWPPSDASSSDENWPSDTSNDEDWPSSEAGRNDENWPPSDAGSDSKNRASYSSDNDEENWPFTGAKRDLPSSMGQRERLRSSSVEDGSLRRNQRKPSLESVSKAQSSSSEHAQDATHLNESSGESQPSTNGSLNVQPSFKDERSPISSNLVAAHTVSAQLSFGGASKLRMKGQTTNGGPNFPALQNSENTPVDQERSTSSNSRTRMRDIVHFFAPASNQRQKRSFKIGPNESFKNTSQKSLKIIRNGKIITHGFRSTSKDKMLVAEASINVAGVQNKSSEDQRNHTIELISGIASRMSHKLKAVGDFPMPEAARLSHNSSHELRPNSSKSQLEEVAAKHVWSSPFYSSNLSASGWIPVAANGWSDSRKEGSQTQEDKHLNRSIDESGQNSNKKDSQNGQQETTGGKLDEPATKPHLDHDALTSAPHEGTKIKVGNGTLLILSFSDVVKRIKSSQDQPANASQMNKPETRDLQEISGQPGNEQTTQLLSDQTTTLPSKGAKALNDTLQVVPSAEVMKRFPVDNDLKNEQVDTVQWSIPLLTPPRMYSLTPVDLASRKNGSNTWVFPSGNGTRQAWILSQNLGSSNTIEVVNGASVANGSQPIREESAAQSFRTPATERPSRTDDMDLGQTGSSIISEQATWKPVAVAVGRVVAYNRSHLASKRRILSF